MDPIRFADLSPYATFADNPIFYNDPNGLTASGDKNPKLNKQGGNVTNEGKGKKGPKSTPQVGEKRDGMTYKGNNSFETDEVVVTGQRPSQATQNFTRAISNYNRKDFFTHGDRSANYGWTPQETQQMSAMLLTGAAMVYTGGMGGGVYSALANLSGRAFLFRALADGGVQTAANWATNRKGLINALQNVNLMETGMVGLGLPYQFVAVGSAGIQFSAEDKFQSTFTGEISLNKFAGQSTIGFGFGALGEGLGNMLQVPTSGVFMSGLYARTSLAMGNYGAFTYFKLAQLRMQHAGSGIMGLTGVSEEILENKVPD